MPEETKPVEREATARANDLLRRLNREVFIDSIDIYRLPHAVGIVMDFAQASADAALERAAALCPEKVRARVAPKPRKALLTAEEGYDAAMVDYSDLVRALKGRE